MRKEDLKAFLIRTLADPVLLYVVIAMMSIMNHYRSIDMWKYAIVSYVAGWFIFRLFDFINKHHFIGTFAYILLLSGFIAGSSAAIELGCSDLRCCPVRPVSVQAECSDVSDHRFHGRRSGGRHPSGRCYGHPDRRLRQQR